MILPPLVYWLALVGTGLMCLMIPLSYWARMATPLSTFAKTVCALCGVILLTTDDPFRAALATCLALVSFIVSDFSERHR